MVVWFERNSTRSPRGGICCRPRTRVKFNGKRKNRKQTKPVQTMATYDAQIHIRLNILVTSTMSLDCLAVLASRADEPSAQRLPLECLDNS